MSSGDITTNRREVITTLGSVAAGGIIAGCSAGEDTPDLSIENVWMEITETNTLQVAMRVRNGGDETAKPMARVRIRKGETLIGEKKQKIVAIPASHGTVQATFSPLEKNVPQSGYTASGTLPGHDWVTAGES